MKLIIKFGGTSVGSAERIENVGQIIKENSKENQLIVVTSALGETTDYLVEIMEKAPKGDNCEKIIEKLEELTDLMSKFDSNEIQIPIPNKRIVDQYAVWVILSRIGVTCSLFGLQDVTQGWVEEKHREHFNPIVLHYTTKKEQLL